MLVIFDGDGTLWSGDVLAGYLTTPLRFIDDDTVEDHQGKRIHLKEGVRDVLDVLRDKEIYVALASENRKLPVVALLQRLKLGQYFNFLEVSWTEKDEMILRILDIFKQKGKETGKVYFIDDFDYNIEIVEENPQLKHIICINASQLQSLNDILDIIVTQTE
ncbi:MAG: magnesium-dependent phosphatase-1 [Theionarchaea archaeon]|nr:magnesium-dependent phosphatase-1 [Theionarchaea archaeon]